MEDIERNMETAPYMCSLHVKPSWNVASDIRGTDVREKDKGKKIDTDSR